MSKRFVPSEDHESKNLAGWLQLLQDAGRIRKFTHIPNEALGLIFLRDPIAAKNLQRMGVRKGVPDFLIVGPTKAFFIELKKTVGGDVSDEQQEWLDAFALVGVDAYVCRGAREAKALVSNLLAG